MSSYGSVRFNTPHLVVLYELLLVNVLDEFAIHARIVRRVNLVGAESADHQPIHADSLSMQRLRVVQIVGNG